MYKKGDTMPLIVIFMLSCAFAPTEARFMILYAGTLTLKKEGYSIIK